MKSLFALLALFASFLSMAETVCPAPSKLEADAMAQYHTSLKNSCAKSGGKALSANGQFTCTSPYGTQVAYYFEPDEQCHLKAMVRTAKSGARPDPAQDYLNKLFGYSALKTASSAQAATVH